MGNMFQKNKPNQNEPNLNKPNLNKPNLNKPNLNKPKQTKLRKQYIHRIHGEYASMSNPTYIKKSISPIIRQSSLSIKNRTPSEKKKDTNTRTNLVPQKQRHSSTNDHHEVRTKSTKVKKYN